jgi:hypothetical protein
MRLGAPVTDSRHEHILELEPLLRRVVGARVRLHPDYLLAPALDRGAGAAEVAYADITQEP